MGFAVLSTALVILAALVVTILPSAMHSIHKPATDEVLIYSDSIAAVKSFPVFYVDEVTIYQSPYYPQSLHELKFLLGKGSCDDLAPRVVPNGGIYLSRFLPTNRTLYLLKGSYMTFNICLVTNDSNNQDGAYLDFYIEEGLEYISKHQRNPRNRFHHPLYYGYTANLSNHPQLQPTSEWKCSNDLTFTVNENGFYSTIMIAPRLIDPADILFWFNFTSVYKFIDVNSYNLHPFCIYSTYEESSPCNIKIQSSEHVSISQHQCIVVDVERNVDSENLSNFGTIVIEYSSWYEGRNAFLGVGLVVLIIFSVLLVILLVFAYKTRAQSNQQNRPTDLSSVS